MGWGFYATSSTYVVVALGTASANPSKGTPPLLDNPPPSSSSPSSHWIAHLGAVHVIVSEELKETSSATFKRALARMVEYLDLKPYDDTVLNKIVLGAPRNERRKKRTLELDEATRETMAAFYSPFNMALCALLRGQADGAECPEWAH